MFYIKNYRNILIPPLNYKINSFQISHKALPVRPLPRYFQTLPLGSFLAVFLAQMLTQTYINKLFKNLHVKNHKTEIQFEALSSEPLPVLFKLCPLVHSFVLSRDHITPFLLKSQGLQFLNFEQIIALQTDTGIIFGSIPWVRCFRQNLF